MHRGKKGAGLVTRREATNAATASPQPSGSGLPWDNARVRDILEPAAEAENLRSRRLIFAMDATASRQPTWDRAIEVQVQLVYFRGSEFFASAWSRHPEELAGLVRGVSCVAGITQIGRVLAHGFAEAERGEVSALVYVGDCMEESRPELASLARRLGARGVKAFLFQDSDDPRGCGVLPGNRGADAGRLLPSGKPVGR